MRAAGGARHEKKLFFAFADVFLGNMVSGGEGKCRNANNTRRCSIVFLGGSNFRLLLRRSRDLLRLPATEERKNFQSEICGLGNGSE